jgi:hypothetical protein
MSAELSLASSHSSGDVIEAPLAAAHVVPGFGSLAGWELLQRQARALAASDFVPPQFKANLANCLLALDVMHRQGLPLLTVLQNLVVIGNVPGWKTAYLVASFNTCGRFSAIRYERTPGACRAWAIERLTRERLDGPTITLEMARAEGWLTRKGSKWATMPEYMLDTRAAAFFIRQVAPEIGMGMFGDDELRDEIEVAPPVRDVRRPRERLEAAAVPAPVPVANAASPRTTRVAAGRQALADAEAAAGMRPNEADLAQALALMIDTARRSSDLRELEELREQAAALGEEEACRIALATIDARASELAGASEPRPA